MYSPWASRCPFQTGNAIQCIWTLGETELKDQKTETRRKRIYRRKEGVTGRERGRMEKEEKYNGENEMRKKKGGTKR